jgi:Na+/proline symporter
VVIFFQFSLFLLIGLILFVYYKDTGQAPPAIPDRIYPQFIWDHLPRGVAGLVMAAVLAAAMSNLSAALNALASTTVMDFWKPLARVERSEAEYLRLSRWITVAWGGVLFAIALVAQSIQSVLESGLSIASIVYGCLLGVFLLGVLTKRTGEKAAMAGMLAGLLTNLYVKFGTTIAWTWYVLIGAVVTVATAVLLSLFLNEERVRHG